MHLIGFIIRIYHDARSPERQIILVYNSSYMFRPNFTAIFRLILEQVECTVDDVFSLRDLVLQQLVKKIVVYYIKDLRLKFKSGTLYSLKIALQLGRNMYLEL